MKVENGQSFFQNRISEQKLIFGENRYGLFYCENLEHVLTNEERKKLKSFLSSRFLFSRIDFKLVYALQKLSKYEYF